MIEKPSIQDYYVALKSTGELEQRSLGNYTYLFFLQAAGSFQWSLDGSTFVDGYQGLAHGPFAPNQRIYFRAAGGRVNSIVFFASNFPTSYFPNTRVQSTYAVGATLNNLPTNALTPIPTGNNGHQRKQIVFSTGYPVVIVIADLAGNSICTVSQGSPITFETDAAFTAYAASAGVNNLLVGELYYTN
jgi:hypothetical protein